MLETSRRLLRVFLEHMVIPAMVGTESLDDAVRLLKEGAVHYVRHRFNADVDLAAMHFGKSTRWIYRVLAREPGGPEPKRRKKQGRDDEEGSGKYGYVLMVAAVQYYLLRRHEGLPASACARALRREGFDVNTVQLAALLDLYCGLGYLTKTIEETGSERDVRYQANRGLMTLLSDEATEERMARVGARAQRIFPIARGYVEGVPGTYFTEISGALLPDDYEAFSSRVRVYLEQALHEAVAHSLARDPEGENALIQFRGLYLIGTGPWTDRRAKDSENVEKSHRHTR